MVIERLRHEAIVLDPRDLEMPAHFSGSGQADVRGVPRAGTPCPRASRRSLVVAMSALTPAAEFLRCGPLEYLEKPFTIDGLDRHAQQVRSGAGDIGSRFG